MPRYSKVKNPTHKQEIPISLDDIRGAIGAIKPLVEEQIEAIAEHVAVEARKRVNRSDKSTDVKRNLDFWPDEFYPHKHLQDNIIVKKGTYGESVWLVKAMRPHAHLVEYGHYMVTHDGRTVGFVRPYPYLAPAKQAVMESLGRMEL